MLEFVDEVDHVLAHRRPVDAVDEPSALEPRVFRFDLLHDLLAERTDLRAARYRHVLVAFVSGIGQNIFLIYSIDTRYNNYYRSVKSLRALKQNQETFKYSAHISVLGSGFSCWFMLIYDLAT